MIEKDGPEDKDVDKLDEKPVGEGVNPLDVLGQVGDPYFISDFPGAVDDTVPPVIGEGIADPNAQIEADLTLADSRNPEDRELLRDADGAALVGDIDLDEDPVGLEDVHIPVLPSEEVLDDPEGLLLAEEMSDDGHDPIDPDILDAAIEEAECGGDADGQTAIMEGYEQPLKELAQDGTLKPKPEYTEAYFREEMNRDPSRLRLLTLFDSLKGAKTVFGPRRDNPSLLSGDSDASQIELQLDRISIIGKDDGIYFVRSNGEFEIGSERYIDNIPFGELESMRGSLTLLQKAFLTYHGLLDETPDFNEEETRFFDASTALKDTDPLMVAYKKLSAQQTKKTPGHQIVILDNSGLGITVYNPRDIDPVFTGKIGNNGGVRIDFSYRGRLPIAFETVRRGLDTLELGYKAFMGLDISPKAE